MNTPADKPDLPAPSHRHPMSGEPIWDEPTVRKALADVRCKTLEDAAEIAESQNHGMDSDYDQAWSASAVQIANRIRALIDKEPT